MMNNPKRIWEDADKARIRSNADEADRLADIVQRRLSQRHLDAAECDRMYNLLADVRSHLKAILRLSNDRKGGV